MISAIIFDLDGTLTTVPSPWRYIHERIGVWESTACHFLDAWLAGRITYDEFCRRDVELWKGMTVADIHDLLDDIPWNRHVPDVVRAVTAERIPSIIISSGFHYVAHRLRHAYAWEPLTIFANEICEGPEVTIRVSPDKASDISKRAHADRTLESLGVSPAETLVVSDSKRDFELLDHCARSVHIRQEDDLRAVLEYLPSRSQA